MIAAANDSKSIFVWSLILVAVVVFGFVLVLWIKRRLRPQEEQPAIGFSLADLRELHRSGKISDEEFERARGKMVASLRRGEEKPKKPQ